MSSNPAELAKSASLRGLRKSVTAAGSQTYYWAYPSDTANSKSMVFIHGYRGNHRGLEAIAGGLTDFDIYIPDLPGFGSSEVLPSELSVENYAAWLSEFIEALKLPSKPVLVGHSFGTIICAKFASEHAEEFSNLVLVNPVSAPALQGPQAFLTKIAMSFFWLAARLPGALAEALLKSWPMVRGMSIVMTKSRDKTLRLWVHRQHDENFNDFAELRVAIEGYHASISNCVGDFVAEFKNPTLFIAGSKDDITSVEQQRAVFSQVAARNSKLAVIEKVGHLTHYEAPGQVAALIRGFVEEQS